MNASLQKDDSDITIKTTNVNRWKLNEETKSVNEILKFVRTKDITEITISTKAVNTDVVENMSVDVKKRIILWE